MSLNVPHINLLQNRQKSYHFQFSRSQKAKTYALISLTVYVLIFIIVSSITAIYQLKLNDANFKLSQAQNAMNRLITIESDYLKLLKKSASAKSVLETRADIVSIWQNLKRIIPVKTEVISLTIDNSQGGSVVTTTITAPHVLLANQVIDVIESQFASIGVTKTTAQINRDATAAYKINLILNLPVSGNKKP